MAMTVVIIVLGRQYGVMMKRLMIATGNRPCAALVVEALLVAGTGPRNTVKMSVGVHNFSVFVE